MENKNINNKFVKIVSFLMGEAMRNLTSLNSGKTPERSFKVEAIASDLKAVSDKNLSESEMEIILDKIIDNIEELA